MRHWPLSMTCRQEHSHPATFNESRSAGGVPDTMFAAFIPTTVLKNTPCLYPLDMKRSRMEEKNDVRSDVHYWYSDLLNTCNSR